MKRKKYENNLTRIGFASHVCCSGFWQLDLLKEFQINMQMKVSKRFSLISKKKRKKDHGMLVAAAMDVLLRVSGDFGHDPSLGKFSDFTRFL